MKRKATYKLSYYILKLYECNKYNKLPAKKVLRRTVNHFVENLMESKDIQYC